MMNWLSGGASMFYHNWSVEIEKKIKIVDEIGKNGKNSKT